MKTAARLARVADYGDAASALYDRVWQFLSTNHLSPDPAHYAFAYRVVTDPGGPLAMAVAKLTEGGVRLLSRDIEELGGGGAPAPAGVSGGDDPDPEGLVAQTQLQVEGFADLMRMLQAETQGFGRELVASADAMRRAALDPMIDEVVQITGEMVSRVRVAEGRLEAATREANELRVKLEEARDNARRDPLTGLPNRRAFEEAYAARIAASGRPIVALCDVDRFKTVNDRFGHQVGDRVLTAIGEALSHACADHFVARYGGEEFAILFGEVAPATARSLLEDARETIAAKRFRLRESSEPVGQVTLSSGLTVAARDEGFATVFARADALLYRAKEEGRNRLLAG